MFYHIFLQKKLYRFSLCVSVFSLVLGEAFYMELSLVCSRVLDIVASVGLKLTFFSILIAKFRLTFLID